MVIAYCTPTDFVNMAFRALSENVADMCAKYDNGSNHAVRPLHSAKMSLFYASWLYDAAWQGDQDSVKRLMEDFFGSLSRTGQSINSEFPYIEGLTALGKIGRTGMYFRDDGIDAFRICYRPIDEARANLIQRGIIEDIEYRDDEIDVRRL